MLYATTSPFTAQQVEHHIRQLFSKSGLTCLFCGCVAGMLNHYSVAPAYWRMTGLMALCFFVLDIFTGVFRSKRVPRKKYCPGTQEVQCPNQSPQPARFNSRDFGNTFIKFTVYMFAFALGTIGDFAIAIMLNMGAIFMFSGGVLAAIAIREFKSNIENIEDTWNNSHQPFAFPFTAIFNVMKTGFGVIMNALHIVTCTEQDPTLPYAGFRMGVVVEPEKEKPAETTSKV